jgi:hypothetical protein
MWWDVSSHYAYIADKMWRIPSNKIDEKKIVVIYRAFVPYGWPSLRVPGNIVLHIEYINVAEYD